MSLRSVIKISVVPTAKAVIERVAERHGMKEISVSSRIYEWFAKQPDVVQKGILGLLPDDYEQDVLELALQRLAKDAKSRPKPK